MADPRFPWLAPAQKTAPQASVEAIAKSARIPISVTFALAEAMGAEAPEQQVAVAERLAATYGPRVAAGEDPRDIIRAELGRDADALLARADQIAQERYPEQWAAKQAKLAESQGGMGNALSSGVSMVKQAYGSAVEGLGRVVGSEGIEASGAETAAVARGASNDAGVGLKTVDDIDGVGSAGQFVGEQLAVNAPQMAASMAGAAAGAAVGSVFPIIGTGIGALIGGVAVNLPFFYGQNRERQKDQIEAGELTEVSEGAAILAAGPQAALDTIVDKLFLGLGPTPAFISAGGLFTRAAKGVVAGAVVEVPTEIGQTILERMQAGLPLADDEAIKEYRDVGIAAGLLGGTVGGVSNAVQKPKGPMGAALEQGTKPPLAQLPAPGNGGTVIPTAPPGGGTPTPGMQPYEPKYGALDDLAAFGKATAGAAIPVGSPADSQFNALIGKATRAGATPEEIDAALAGNPPARPPAPQGPLGEAATMAPPPILAGATEGQQVTVTQQGDDPIYGQFVSENPVSITIQSIDGEVMEIPRTEVEAGTVQITPTQAEVPPEPGTGPLVQEGAPPVITEVDPGGLAATAMGAIKKPPVKAPRPPQTDISSLGEEQARARLAFIEEQGRTNGWKPDLVTERDNLQRVVDGFDGLVTKKDGSPFGDEAAAKRALKSRKLDPEGYDIEARNGGFVARPKKAGGADNAGQEQSPLAPPLESPEVPGGPVLGQPDPVQPAVPPEMPPVGEVPPVEAAPTVEPGSTPPAALTLAQRLDAGGTTSTLQEGLTAAGKRWLRSEYDAGRLERQPGLGSNWTYRRPQPGSDATWQRAEDVQITASPVAPDSVRSQPDMLGGEATSEEAMAAKERRKREWGQFLGIAEHGKSDWDGELEGRPVRIRRNKVRIMAGDKASDADMILDAEGMSKEDIAGWTRDTLRRMPPVAGQEPVKEATKAPEAEPVAPAPVKETLTTEPAKPADELVTVRDVYGDRHRVRKSELDNPEKQILSRRDANGDRLEGPGLARGNIDTDGTGVTATYAGSPIIGTRRDDKPLSSEAAVRKEITFRGQKQHDFDIRAVPGGFLGVRKAEVAPTAAEVAETAQTGAESEPAPAQTSPQRDRPDEEAVPQVPATQQPDAELTPEPAPTPKPAKALIGLSDAENAELAALEAEFLALSKGQINSGLDPRLVSVAFKIGSLYVKAGSRRFRAFLDQMMDRLGLTLEQAQPYARNAYAQIRDDLELAGEDVTDMDAGPEVIAEIRKMRLAEAKKPKEPEAKAPDAEPVVEPEMLAEKIEAAAAETDSDPTPAQAEAENYRTGKVQWNGLTLSIESAKGSIRKGTAADGTEWQVKMPAHYGRILKTTGADGDHVDFYMGDTPESDLVYVIDQIDLGTGAFDETKSMLGFKNRKTALDFYVQGFSDGKGADRIGGHKVMSVDEFKTWLAEGDHSKPVRMGEEAAAAPKPKKSTSRMSIAQAKKERAAALTDYFTPGNIVRAYGNSADRVISFRMTEDGGILVEVQEVRKQGGEWVPPPGSETRIHGTMPTDRELKAGPLERVAPASVPPKPEWNPAEITATASDTVEVPPEEFNPIPPAPAPDAKQTGKLQDFGEKIGGARKDLAQSGWKRASGGKAKDERPGWMRRYEVNQIVKSTRPEDQGKWSITDTKTGSHVRGSGYRTVLFDTEAEAIAMIPRVEVARLHRVYATKDGQFGIFRNVSDRKRPLIKGGFASHAEAMQFMAERPEEIIEAKTRIDDSIHPALEEAIRIGEDRRKNGADVGPDDFKEVFGFRAVEFGNWNNSAERQHLLNQAYDAMLDMAQILRVPPKAVSLNGDLALAFGSRGSGLSGARAHYERNYGTINLTKIHGAGALAHEWWHAVDHYFGRQDGKAKNERITNERGDTVFDATEPAKDYASHGFQYRGSGVRPEVRAAFERVVKAVFERKAEYVDDLSTREKIAQRAKDAVQPKLDQLRAHLAVPTQWGKKKAAATPEQLARIDAAIARIQAKDYGEKKPAPSKAYGKTFLLYEPVLDLAEVYKEVRGRQAYGVHQGRTSGYAVDIQYAIENLEKSEALLADAQDQRTKMKTVKTEFFSEAWKLDQGSATDYWSTNHEMIARAFEAWVYDRLKGIEARNDFLSYEKRNDLPEYRLLNVKPYPEGNERQEINAAFEALFDVIQTRETESGVAMESRMPAPERGAPVATLTGQELGTADDILALGKAAGAWYRDNLIGQEVTNAETGWSIRFSRKGANKIGGRKGEDLYRMVPALREMIANGRLVSSEPVDDPDGQTRAFHRFAASVELSGVIKDVIVTVRESANGRYHYDLSRDMSDGARFSLPSSPVVEAGARGAVPTVRAEKSAVHPTLEGSPVTLNIEFREPASKPESAPSGWGEVEADPPLTEAAIAGITRDLNAELARSGLTGKATVRVVKGLVNSAGIEVQGLALGSRIGVNPDAAFGALDVMRHEIVHVLRNAALWGSDHGLFTAEEWRGLVREARRDKATSDRIDALYKDRSEAVRTEEKVAELYRIWAAKRDQTGPVAAALRKIMGFLEAVASALRGRGFQSAARTMEKIARGEVGGRGPDTPNNPRDSKGRYVGRAAEQMEARDATQTDAFKRWFGKSKVTDGDGKPMVMLHSTHRDFTVFDPFAAEAWHQKKYHDGVDQVGIWFTSEKPEIGKDGNLRGRYGPKAIQAYVKIEKPLYIEDESVDDSNEGKPTFGKDDVFTRLKTLMQRESKGSARAFREMLRSEGYDGIVLTGWLDGYRGYVAIALDSAQIKSIDNQGTFDPDSGDINELRLPDVPYAANEAARDARDRGIVSRLLTDAMGGWSNRYNLLALVPGRALYAELGKNLPGAQRYLRMKDAMDALRSKWHGKTDEVAQAWVGLIAKDRKANAAMMDLMHEATRAGVDPSERFRSPQRRPGVTLQDHADLVRDLKDKHDALRPKFMALPAEFQAMFRTVRDTYDEMATAFERAILDNVKKAMDIGLQRAERAYSDQIKKIEDDGLTGEAKAEAEAAAAQKLQAAKRRHGWGQNARITSLRAKFESNRLDGPYFPLQRFGNYFVTVRDANGKVVSFSKFESEKKQQQFAAEMQKQGFEVESGVMEDMSGSLREQVDAGFVADIEKILGDEVGDPAIMDMVWQRWLETLPDFSVRKSRIHRKGTPGFSADAFRAFGRQVFHGSHQLARLTYAMDMQKALEDAQREAAASSDPNRNGLIVNEMGLRNQFVMNPTGGAAAQAITSAAFVYYLGATPAAAIVNLTQTTIMGVPILSAAFEKATVARAAWHLQRAMGDFTRGRGKAERSKRITAEERAAMQAAYDSGLIEASQSHDLAGVKDSGVEYSSWRTAVMAKIAWMFHHAERTNREVTFLAAYRMARENGFAHDGAITKASDLTWKTHFDYQSTSRPRLMQNDTAKVLLVFRNFQINALWRLFRDMHQWTRGKTPAEQKEARAQLLGITAMMMLHAGVTGTWGYALSMTIAGLVMGGGSDEAEEELQRAVVDLFGVDAAGLILKGVPGHFTGLDLTNRIGMPELWFRAPDRQLEGKDAYLYWLQQVVGAAAAIPLNMFVGADLAMDGELWRGFEAAAPKTIRDVSKAIRWEVEGGVTNLNGETLVENVDPSKLFMQAMGFTPAKVAEQYRINSRLMNRDAAISAKKRGLLDEATEAIRAGETIDPDTMKAIRDYNAENPDDPITGQTVMRSLKARLARSARTEGGIVLTGKRDERLREEAAPPLYQ